MITALLTIGITIAGGIILGIVEEALDNRRNRNRGW